MGLLVGGPGIPGFALAVAERLLHPARELVLAGSGVAVLRDAALARFDPFLVVGHAAGEVDAGPSATVCEGFTCQLPVATVAELVALLKA